MYTLRFNLISKSLEPKSTSFQMKKSILTKKLLLDLFEKEIKEPRCILTVERFLYTHFINIIYYEKSGKVVRVTPGKKFTRSFDYKEHHTGTAVNCL